MSEREKRMYCNEVGIREATYHDNLINVVSYNKWAYISCPRFNYKQNVTYPYIQMEYIKNGELFH